jgi:hypothetical protein
MNGNAPEHWPRYRLYGVTLASDFPFANRLPPASGPCDLVFSGGSEETHGFDLENVKPAYASPPRPGRSKPLLSIYRLEDDGSGHGQLVTRIEDIVEYYLYPDRILYRLLEPSCAYLVEIQLLGHVFAIWLESRGVPAVHASAVVVGERAVAFLAGNKAGKSSLAASLMQAGCPLLTDDILPLDCTGEGVKGRPGYPQMRLWPDQAEHFLGHHRELEIVHPAYSKRWVAVDADGFGTFWDRPAPLGCLYLPEMRADGVGSTIEIEPVPPREAFAHLLRCSFIGAAAEILGWQSSRFRAVAQVANAVAVRRLRYPPKRDLLAEVRQAVLADFAALVSPRHNPRTGEDRSAVE